MANLYKVVKEVTRLDSNELSEEISLVTAWSVEQVCAQVVEDICCDGRLEIMSITRVGSVIMDLTRDEYEPKYEPSEDTAHIPVNKNTD